ncbi:hypothetical protein Tco_0797230 [Tanacetum coccineum]
MVVSRPRYQCGTRHTPTLTFRTRIPCFLEKKINNGKESSNRGSTYGRLIEVDFLKFNGGDVNAWLFRVQQFFLIDGDDHKTRLKSTPYRLKLGKGFPFHEIRDDQHEGEKAKKKHLIGKSSSIPSTQTTDKQVEKQTTGNTVAVKEMNVGLMLISEVETEALADKEVIYLVSDDEMEWVHDENYDTKPEPTVGDDDKKGSKAKMGLKPSINRAWAVDFDEDDIEEIFEKRLKSEVATEFDPNAYHDIERWEDRHKFFYR